MRECENVPEFTRIYLNLLEFVVLKKKKHLTDGPTNRRTDQRIDGPTDRRTDGQTKRVEEARVHD